MVFGGGSTHEESDLDKRSYPLKSASNSYNMFNLGPGEPTQTTVEARPGNCPSDGDDQSDKSILNQQGKDERDPYNSSYLERGVRQKDIKTTTEVHISYT